MMEWTTDKPTVPGWYWWKNDAYSGIFFVGRDGLWVNGKPTDFEDYGGEWSSTPIPTPGGER